MFGKRGLPSPHSQIVNTAHPLRRRARAGGRAARRREHPSGGQRVDVLAHRPGVPRRRYIRLHGVGALRCGGGGAVQRRGPGNGPRQPHLRHASGGAGPAPLKRAGKFGITWPKTNGDSTVVGAAVWSVRAFVVRWPRAARVGIKVAMLAAESLAFFLSGPDHGIVAR